MQILIAGKPAVIKKGSSFEYVSENRLFSGADGYTFTIEFPLRGCPQNQEIFGHISRKDVTDRKLVFNGEISDLNFRKTGCFAIIEKTDIGIKAQFLDGRSEQNYDTSLDNTYINELYLGQPLTTSTENYTPRQLWEYGQQAKETCLPWVNNYSGNVQNDVYPDGVYETWGDKTDGLSWQIYLIELTRRICSAIGYSIDLSAWEAEPTYKYLLVCNTLPYAWGTPEYARALPHWTVEEYFEKLELFLGCEFNIDHRSQSIEFYFTRDKIRSLPYEHITDILEEYSTEVKVTDPKCEYIGATRLKYKECDHKLWKYYSCQWYIDAMKVEKKDGESLAPKEYDTLRQLLEDNSECRYSLHPAKGLYAYARDFDLYLLQHAIARHVVGYEIKFKWIKIWEYQCIPMQINNFGPSMSEEIEGVNEKEIEFVPARIDYLDPKYGMMLYLSFGDYSEKLYQSPLEELGLEEGDEVDDHTIATVNDYWLQFDGVRRLDAGEGKSKSEYYDRIYIGWYDGTISDWNPVPYPYIYEVTIKHDWSDFKIHPFSFRLNDKSFGQTRYEYEIDPQQKYTFKFLSNRIPDVRAVFLIKGKRYLCEKLTADFTEDGMSSLIKGDFYRITS